MKTTINIEVFKSADTLTKITRLIALNNEGLINVDLIQLAAFFEVEFAMSNYYYKEKGAVVDINEEEGYLMLSEDKGETFFCKLSSVGETAKKQLDKIDLLNGNFLSMPKFNTAHIKLGFIVLLDLGGSYQPTFHVDEKIMFFDAAEEAQTEIDEFIKETKEAVKRGDMDDECSPEDYRIVPAILNGGTITCDVDGVSYSMLITDEDYTPTDNFPILNQFN